MAGLAKQVLGGECVISSTLDANGTVVHLNDVHTLLFGERNGARSERVQAIATAFSRARFDGRSSETILQEMWEKWVFIAAAAGITCLMRATVGDIVAAEAAEFASRLLGECAAIAVREGFPPREGFLDRNRRIFTAAGSPLTASMLRDIERGAPIEADHIVGDLLRRAPQENSEPRRRVLRITDPLPASKALARRDGARGTVAERAQLVTVSPNARAPPADVQWTASTGCWVVSTDRSTERP